MCFMLLIEQWSCADDPAALLQNAIEFSEDALGLRQMLEDLVEHDRIEAFVFDRYAGQVAHIGALGILLVDFLEIGAFVASVVEQLPVWSLSCSSIQNQCTGRYS
jgi:hypothetical protein